MNILRSSALVCAMAVLIQFPLHAREPRCESSCRTVQIADCHIYEEASFLSPKLMTINYSQQVSVLKRSSRWLLVKPPAEDVKNGWVHDAALTDRQIFLEAPDKKRLKRLRKGEAALAGRAFRGAVERAYRKRDRELDAAFELIDSHVLEAPEFQPGVLDLENFRKDGGLQPIDGRNRHGS